MVLVQVGTWTPNGSKYEMVLFFYSLLTQRVPIVQLLKHWPADPAVPLEMGILPIANGVPLHSAFPS